MALKKSSFEDLVEEEKFSSLEEALNSFRSSDNNDIKNHALSEMLHFEGGSKALVSLLEEESNHSILDIIGMYLVSVEANEAPIDDILKLLNSDDAYVRNLAITVLRDYGDAIKYYIVKYLIGDDSDLRIFAINVLGDVSFSESREMLIELLESEEDLNVAMTAVDYLGEIGEEEDIPLLESLKDRFEDEFYVSFAVDNTIKLIQG
jgi:HEAT repeat protein